eukprot:1156108-Pelagomonas_calceolata.AAC.7
MLLGTARGTCQERPSPGLPPYSHHEHQPVRIHETGWLIWSQGMNESLTESMQHPVPMNCS